MAHDSELPEPKTPMWLPALGAAVFLAAGLWWLARPQPPQDSTQQAATGVDAGADAGADAASPK
jgi:ferric-dicitrate binding protein FerR (iron transport regulator)